MTHRPTQDNMGGGHAAPTSSQVNFSECADVLEGAAAYQNSFVLGSSNGLERAWFEGRRDIFLADAKRYRELAK